MLSKCCCICCGSCVLCNLLCAALIVFGHLGFPYADLVVFAWAEKGTDWKLARSAKFTGSCTLPVESQMLRLASGVNFLGPHVTTEQKLEAGLVPPIVPEHLLMTLETNAACGWELEFHDCALPCSELKHDEFMVVRNRMGNAVVPPGTCAIVFAGSNDDHDWSFSNEIARREWELFRAGQSVSELSMFATMRGHSVFAGKYYEYVNLTHDSPRWAEWMELAHSSACTELIFTGFSLGASVAEFAWLDVADVEPGGKGTYNCSCFGGKPCHVMAFGGEPVFFGPNVPEIGEHCRNSSKSIVITMEHDPIPTGDPGPIGGYPERFIQMYGQDALRTVNHILGAHRIQFGIGPSCMVRREDWGYTSTTYRDSWKRGIDLKLAPYIGLERARFYLYYLPWHLEYYYLYALDAYHFGFSHFFCKDAGLKALRGWLPHRFAPVANQTAPDSAGITQVQNEL